MLISMSGFEHFFEIVDAKLEQLLDQRKYKYS